jgi:peptide/nickel transport system substrate-binding protein
MTRNGEGTTRRRLIQLGGAGVATIGAGSLLAACGGGGSGGGGTTPSGDGGGGTPKRGGTLRIGATGGTNADTLELQNSLTSLDQMRAGALSEQLMIMNPKTGLPDSVLAESVESNKNGTQWTIRVRDGVTFHDGKPLTAKDVLYSLQRIEKNKFAGLVNLGSINLGGAKVVDTRTLRVPFDSPFAVLPEALAGAFTIRMVPVGFDPKRPVGTGPFKYTSFTPGQQSTFDRYDGYWQNGKPYADTVNIINFADETAQVNALQSGQVDLVNALSYTSVAAVKGNGSKTVVSKTGAFVPFTMRVDKAPFNDVRVRQALRLAVNRKEFNEQLFGGLGSLGNDVFGAIDPMFKELPQRTQDVEQAKSLLKAAGQSDLRVSLYTTATGPGAEAGASVFASQLKAAGVTVNLVRQQPTQFWGQSYTKVPFGLSFWIVASYLTQAGMGMATGAPFNEIHQSDARWQSLYEQALKTVDTSAREEIVKEMLQYDYDKGGYIVPVNYPSIEGMSGSVYGVTENITGFPINGSNGMQEIWLQS